MFRGGTLRFRRTTYQRLLIRSLTDTVGPLGSLRTLDQASGSAASGAPSGRGAASRFRRDPADDLSVVIPALRALADETRLRIAGILGPGPMAVCEIAEELEVPQPLVSFHLAKLRRAGLVSTQRNGKWTYCFLNRELVFILVRAVADLAPDRIG